MSTVSGRSGAFEPDRPVACIQPVWDPGCNTTRPLPSGGPVGQDGPMREGAGRDLGTGPGAGRSWGPGAHVSPLPRAATTLGGSPEPAGCAPSVVDACGYDRDGSAAPSAE